jgi:hypothetical protein
MTANREHVVRWGLAIVAAAVGGVAGIYVFAWLLERGLYAMILPGAAVGLGGTLLMRKRSPTFGVVCGVMALLVGLFAHWKVRWPGDADDPGLFFVMTHPHQLPTLALLMILLGCACAFWFGFGQAKREE